MTLILTVRAEAQLRAVTPASVYIVPETVIVIGKFQQAPLLPLFVEVLSNVTVAVLAAQPDQEIIAFVTDDCADVKNTNQGFVTWVSDVIVILLPPPVTVKTPPLSNVYVGVVPPASFLNVIVLASTVSDILWKVVDWLPAIAWVTTPVSEIVPPLALNVPLFVKFPPRVKVPEVEVNIPEAATKKAPVEVIVGLFVAAVTVTAFVPLPTVTVPVAENVPEAIV